MAKQVCNGALLKCSFGLAPSTLIVLPTNRVNTNYVPAANIMDHKPLVNIMTFGMCNTVSNPAVAATTSAALGVLTPAPCIPATSSPWVPGAPTVMLGSQPTLNDTSKCMCLYGGVIEVTYAGQVTVDVP